MGILVGLAGCFNPDPAADFETDIASTSGSSTSDGPTSPSTTTTDPSMGSTSSGPTVCEVCIAAAPEEWVGPLALGSGDSAPSCATPFTVVAFDAVQDVAGDDASCACECGDAAIDCGELSLRYSSACAGVLGAESFTGADTCHDTSPDGPSVTAFFTPIAGTESCPSSPTIDIPAATMTELILCGGSFDQDTCSADEVCVGTAPEGFETALCVAREGEHECPEAYPNARSAFGDVADDRRCTSCDCSASGDFECSSELTLFADAACGTAAGSDVTDECIDTPTSFRFAEPTVAGTCTPSAVEPQGSIAGEDPITICCQ